MKNKLFILCFFLLLLASTYSCAERSYKAAITAKELLVLMTACDLLPAAEAYSYSTVVISEMCSQGKRLLKAGMSNSGPQPWVWQPGKMTDHDDFKYAGNANIDSNLQEKKVTGISLDSAHFYAKWPLFFLSAKNSAKGEDKIFFQNAIDGLIANLIKNVVIKSESECVIRYKNYIDGTNGVYRWNYENKGLHTGHSEFALSYTPFFSSLALLDSEIIARHYKDIESCYPYSTEERKKYFWSRGLEEEHLLVLLSQKQPSAVKGEVPSNIEKNYYDRFFSKRVKTNQKITTQDAYASVVGDRMLVMHYAFNMGYKYWMADFHAYADKVSQFICLNCKNDFSFYDSLHLIYFLGKYVYLANESSEVNREQLKVIFERVIKKIEDLYLSNQTIPVSNYGWDGVLIFNFKDYTEWKLAYYNTS